ncbi:uncharacterized protein [Littorina saxatilis]|uniref:uncharacterized protein n=1 Tax=Littorina saxatilis TaxID=31220 RepID=UPI0038B591DB
MTRYILATVSVFLAMSGAGCLLVAAIGTLCGPRSLDPSRVTEGHLLTHLAVNGIYIFLFITGWFLMIILTLVLVFVSLTQQFTCREINSLHVFGNVSNSTSDEQFFQNTLRACQTVTDFPTTLGVPVNARHDHRDLGHASSTAAPVVTTVTPTRDEGDGGDGGTVVAVLQQAVELINTYNAHTNFSFDFSVLEALGRMVSGTRLV